MRSSNMLENKTPSDTYGRVQLVCKKVPAHSSLELGNTIENTIANLPKVSRAKFQRSDGLFHSFYYRMLVLQIQEPFCNNY